MKFSSVQRDTLKTLTDALVYEPCCVKGSREKKYLTEKPIQIARYLEEFVDEYGISNDVSMVVDGPKLATCSGHGDNKHTYMIDEGTVPCMRCGMKKCRLCIMKHVITVEDRNDEIEDYCSMYFWKNSVYHRNLQMILCQWKV